MDKVKCIIFGGSGEVGEAVARELLKSDLCSKLTMLGRRIVISLQDEAKAKQVVVETSSHDFEEIVKEVNKDFVQFCNEQQLYGDELVGIDGSYFRGRVNKQTYSLKTG